MYSSEHIAYLKSIKKEKRIIILFKILIIVLFLLIWEVSSRLELINPFLFSRPTLIIETIINLYKNNNLLRHIWVSFYEVIIGFGLSTFIGILLASFMWFHPRFAKVIDPYLTIINSLPKVSLGPLIIIWAGANIKSIILMAILITTFTSAISLYDAFIKTDEEKITLFKSLKATKMQTFFLLVFRGNLPTLCNVLKINISMSLIGVIMGELLVSKEGLGYLITYGSQVFNLNLVISSIFILGVLSYLLYFIVNKFKIR